MEKSSFCRALVASAWFCAMVPAALASAPVDLQVPALAVDDSSVVLVWRKPDDYAAVADYRVFMNGQAIGTANANPDQHSPAKPYVDKFYASDTDRFHVRVSQHNFTVTGLKPDTEYRFTVRAVYADGKESADSNVVVQRTTPVPRVISIVEHGAKGDGTTLNTEAIAKAIAACPPGCKVLVPQGVFKTGAIWLKSNMTLEIAEGATLLGSERPEDYPAGYKLYAYYSFTRPASLINAIKPDGKGHGDFENIRIVGKGTIDGNGWKQLGTVEDETGRSLPRYVASNNRRYAGDGILASAQVAALVKQGMPVQLAYGQGRSSLITVRGVKNMYYAGFTALNPAYHGIMNLDSENVTVNGVAHKTFDANNADGIEFGNSRNVMVFNNFFDTGDDCVNFAAGTGAEAAKQPPMSGAWIFNNYFREGHGMVVMGSHTGAWIEKVLAEDNVGYLTEIGLRQKSSSTIGGGARDVVFRDSALRSSRKQPFHITVEYSDVNASAEYPPAATPARFQDITVRNVSVEGGSGSSIEIKGDAARGIFHENIRFDSVRFSGSNPAKLEGVKNSVFHDVRFSKMRSEASPWSVREVPGVTFTGDTPTP